MPGPRGPVHGPRDGRAVGAAWRLRGRLARGPCRRAPPDSPGQLVRLGPPSQAPGPWPRARPRAASRSAAPPASGPGWWRHPGQGNRCFPRAAGPSPGSSRPAVAGPGLGAVRGWGRGARRRCGAGYTAATAACRTPPATRRLPHAACRTPPAAAGEYPRRTPVAPPPRPVSPLRRPAVCPPSSPPRVRKRTSAAPQPHARAVPPGYIRARGRAVLRALPAHSRPPADPHPPHPPRAGHPPRTGRAGCRRRRRRTAAGMGGGASLAANEAVQGRRLRPSLRRRCSGCEGGGEGNA
jgi:hypothetical protein